MIIPKYARYDYCNRRACEFLEEFSISSFPVNVEDIIHLNKWGLVTYSELMQQFHCNRHEVIRYLGSADGFTTWDGQNYTIAYNDDISLGERTRFTLMHEIGHIYLHHLTDFEATQIYRGSLTKEENKVLENEANAFARNVLIPTSLLQQLSNKDVTNIAYRFGVTPAAAQTRLDLYKADVSENQQQNLLNRLWEVFQRFYYKKCCLICGYHTISKSLKYCPICGHDSIQWGDGNKMLYPTYDTDGNGRLKKCIICNNEFLLGRYCHICSSDVINYCTDAIMSYNDYEQCTNTMPLPSNARYCHCCGSESTFYRKTILKAWNYQDNISTDGFMNIPEGIDEELPFN